MKAAGSYLERLQGSFGCAEDFFHHFGIAYDARVLNVSRLHILKRYTEYLRSDVTLATLDEETQRTRCGLLLQQAYDDFVLSTPAREKLFKVFQGTVGHRIPLERLRDSLRKREAA